MKTENLLKIKMIALILLLVTPTYIAFAGSKNQNGDNGTQGPDKLNGIDGCRPNEGNQYQIQESGLNVGVLPCFASGAAGIADKRKQNQNDVRKGFHRIHSLSIFFTAIVQIS